MIASIWIEIRPALRCCHVCIVLQKNITSRLILKIKKASLLLEANSNSLEINFPDFIVEPLTITNVRLTATFLNFRIQAEYNFKCQILPFQKLKPPVNINEKTSFLCYCDNSLTREIIFDRVLPLPSSQFNLSDMFCHFSNPSIFPNNLKPDLNDCFFSDDYIVVNNEIVTGCLKKDKFFKCKRCLTKVGVCDNNSVKFWNSSVKLIYSNLSLLDHFKHLIWKVISNPISPFPKILLESEEIQAYLLIIIMDRNLVISTCKENLKLKNTEVVKLKYKFYSSLDSHVQSLKDDPFISLHHFQVHKILLDFSVKFLISNSKTIPPIFSKEDDEFMTYLSLSDLF